METLHIRSKERNELIDITDEVREVVRKAGTREGVVVLQSLHTTGALTINENADPDVPHDLAAKLAELVPERESYYRHAEGNSDSHQKTSLYGPSLTVIVDGGDLVLGRWQGIFFCEFDGPRDRKVAVRVLGGG